MEIGVFRNPKSVTIRKSRWNVDIIVETDEGEQRFIASADSWYTQGDGIWLGTPEEFEEAGW